MKVKRYRPAFFEGFEDEIVEQEIFDPETLPWRKNWKDVERFELKGPHCIAYLKDKSYWVYAVLLKEEDADGNA